MKRLTLRVHVESLFARGRVRTDDGVLVDDGLTSLDATASSSSVDLLDTRVRSLEAV